MSTKATRKLIEKKLGAVTFGMFLRACRTSQDKTQSEMAGFLGITKSTLCDMEKGRQGVSPRLAAKIAAKCGLSRVLAVELAVKDWLARSGLKMDVHITESKKASGF